MANEDFSVFRRVAVAAAVVALGVLALFLIGRSTPSPLPEYELALTGGAQTTLGAPAQLTADTLRVRGGARVQIAARPLGKAEGEIAARAFLIDGGAAKTWNAPLEITPEGVVRVAGEAGIVFPKPSGDWDVVVAIARSGALPTEANVLGLLASPVPGVKTVRAHVVVSGS